MALIITKIDLLEFKKDLERKKAVLNLSLVFNNQEKKQAVLKCCDELIEIADRLLTEDLEVISQTL